MSRKIKFLGFWIVLAGILLASTSVLAQTYSFSLDQQIVDVYWNSDGSLAINDVMTFTNDPQASAIDYVDVGMPNSNYDLGSIQADVNGSPIQDIQNSEYVKPGVALGLGPLSIPPGSTGKVSIFVPSVTGVLYTDSQDDSYASADFSPTWFGSEYVHGASHLTIIYHLPPGVTRDEPRWHAAPIGFPEQPATGMDNDGRITYTWDNSNASGSTQYKFGASFPKKYVPADTIVTPTISTDIAAWIGGLISTLACFGLPALFVILTIASIVKASKRKFQYLPPKIAIEGHGIKRGLTAIEAAILLEEPLDKILTMILFAVIKKNAARVKIKSPLEIEALAPSPADLQSYETKFIKAYEIVNKKERQEALQNMVIEVIKGLQEKMRGFSRKETIAYYRDIVNRAWTQVEAADTPEVKSQKYDEVMEWTMLDRDFDGRTRRVFQEGPVFVPIWWSHYDPGFPRTAPLSTSSTSVPSPLPGGSLSLPHLPGSDFAASIVNSVQNVSASAVSNISDFTSRITNKTNPPPVTTTTRSSSGGGGGCVCACACACAGCACACAGGGR